MLSVFVEACTPAERQAMGVEWEKEVVHPDGRRVTFTEPGGVQDALKAMARSDRWRPHREGPHVVGLHGAGSHVTLEPGAQIEIATPPRRSIAELETDLRAHLADLQGAFAGADVHILTTAFTPIQPVAEIPFVPKGRYAVMQRYLQRTGALAHAMMKGTTSAQYAIDFASEEDCGRKLSVSDGLSPVVTALSANSPLVSGAPTGDLSARARAWLRTDPARTALPSSLIASFSFEAYLDWALAVPMMFVRRDGRWFPAHGRSFRHWIDHGIDGRKPDMADFDLHLTSLFPDVRLKGFLEIRGADNGSPTDILALAAFWKGLLYDPGALEQAETVVQALRAGGERGDLLELAITEGLGGRWGGRRLRSWIGLLLEAAEAGLGRQGPRGPGEIAYLAPLRERAAAGRSPAEDVLDAWRREPDVPSFLAAIALPAVADIPRVTPGPA